MKELFAKRDAAGVCVLCGQPEGGAAGSLREFMSSQAHASCATEAERDLARWECRMAESRVAEAEYRYADLREAEAIYLNDVREKHEAERAEIQSQFDAREWYSK